MKKKDLCLRDGLCCLIKEYHPLLNLWVVTDKYCNQFEWIQNNGKKVGNCKIYQTKKDRQLVMPGVRCIDAEDMVKSRLQPESCPYSKMVPGYKCRAIGFEDGSV